jgi:hypothetical protein
MFASFSTFFRKGNNMGHKNKAKEYLSLMLLLENIVAGRMVEIRHKDEGEWHNFSQSSVDKGHVYQRKVYTF